MNGKTIRTRKLFTVILLAAGTLSLAGCDEASATAISGSAAAAGGQPCNPGLCSGWQPHHRHHRHQPQPSVEPADATTSTTASTAPTEGTPIVPRQGAAMILKKADSNGAEAEAPQIAMARRLFLGEE